MFWASMNLSRDKFKMYERKCKYTKHAIVMTIMMSMIFILFFTYQIMNSSIVKSLAYPPWNRILVLYLYNVQTGVGQTFSVSLTNFATF